jgi:cation diffusion facilitator CzcD-associated flavoprotein CzcO
MTQNPAIAIIGAGFGGLAAALELKRHGLEDFVILDRQQNVGGVWCANTYPGAACDVPSEIYSFAAALKPDWSRRFGSQAEIQRYLADVARDHDLDRHLRFGVEVEAATWHEDRACWQITIAGGETITAGVVICATGQLSRPRIPDIPGRESFAGAQFHSAEWDHTADLRGKHVTVVGGGASAVQIAPAIADTAAHVTVVQRSPSWIVPKYDWAQGRLEQLAMHLPGATRLRHNVMWWKFESNVPIISRRFDPMRKVIEARLRRLILRKVKDPELARAITPTYPFGCNRVLLSSSWYPTLARRDVNLLPDAITALDPSGLSTSSGAHVDTDVIIWCTGFTPTEYLAPMRITGRDGADLREQWSDGPEAYLGMVTPGFPNLFMSYGPNTGSLTNTIIFMLERQAGYIRQAVQHVGRLGGSLEIRRDVHDAFNRELQARLQKTVFTAGCPGWYATADGKVTTVWPGSHVAYARATRDFDPSVYAYRPSPDAADLAATEKALA